MRVIGARYQLWQIMLAIAALAMLFAWLGVTSAVAVLIVAGVIGLPVVLAGPGRRIRALALVCSTYPLLWMGSLYATWFTARLVLGHRPRVYLDDPKFISPIVDVPYNATFLLLMGLPMALVSCIPLVFVRAIVMLVRREVRPWVGLAWIVLPVLVWGFTIAVGRWDLFEANTISAWFID